MSARMPPSRQEKARLSEPYFAEITSVSRRTSASRWRSPPRSAAGGCWTRSTLGFRLRAVGANQFAARTAGISVTRIYVWVMLIAGLLMGLAGGYEVLSQTNSGQVTATIDNNVCFDAITVALLGLATPGGTVLAALLFGALDAGGQAVTGNGVPQQLPQVMEAVIVLFIAAPQLVRMIFRLRKPRDKGGHLAKGWNG